MYRYRPGVEKEQFARDAFRQQFPLATSSYTLEGAVVYDEKTKLLLGSASEGDWAVELAWQDAAKNVSQTTLSN